MRRFSSIERNLGFITATQGKQGILLKKQKTRSISIVTKPFIFEVLLLNNLNRTALKLRSSSIFHFFKTHSTECWGSSTIGLYLSICLAVLSHISSPVIGRHSSLSNGSHWLTQYSLCAIKVYRVVRSSDHGDLSRKNPLTMRVCPMKKLLTLRRNLMRLTKILMKLEEQN